MLTPFLSPIINAIFPASLRAGILRPIAELDTAFFNNSRAIRVFFLWCAPGIFLMILSLFVPAAIAYCPGALWLAPVGLIFAYAASRRKAE